MNNTTPETREIGEQEEVNLGEEIQGQEIYRKCEDLHTIFMRLIEETSNPVYKSTLIDVNAELVTVLEEYYEKNKVDRR
ncbi:hypothetical protein DFQ29_005860 [Apophysomyces sp. BC1021]|nr:hypothetical protein DFQ29_005860 [Apophysomyces sp. BC1021]